MSTLLDLLPTPGETINDPWLLSRFDREALDEIVDIMLLSDRVERDIVEHLGLSRGACRAILSKMREELGIRAKMSPPYCLAFKVYLAHTAERSRSLTTIDLLRENTVMALSRRFNVRDRYIQRWCVQYREGSFGPLELYVPHMYPELWEL